MPGGATVGKHSYTYNPIGNIATWKREAPLANPSGATSEYHSTVYYDTADQVSSVVNAALPGSSVANTGNHYLYDLAGNIASKQVETFGTGATMTTYSHNNLNQITGIGGSGGVKQVIVRGETNEPATVKVRPIVQGIASAWKDARMLEGNRFESDQDLATGSNQLNIEAKDGSNNVSNYTYNLTLAAAAAATPSYDADGNLLSDGVRSYEWDRLSRLVKITWGGSPVRSTEYRYNSLGQRSDQIEKSGTTETARYYYLYEGKDLLCRYTGGTAVANIDRQYLIYGEQRKSGSVWSSYYYNLDHLGSIREVMNSDGSLAARYDYDPYGKRVAQYEASGYTCDLGFTGHITQPSGVSGQGEIVLTLFRAYDPLLGRWLSADPLGEAGGLNLYRYVKGDPINSWDPYGLCDMNFFPPEEPIKCAADKAGNNMNVITVGGHGTPQTFANRDHTLLTPTQLAEYIMKHPKFLKNKDMPIMLLSCNTGVSVPNERNFAQWLANNTGRIVYAPDGYWMVGEKTGRSYINKEGHKYNRINNGNFIPHYPETITSTPDGCP